MRSSVILIVQRCCHTAVTHHAVCVRQSTVPKNRGMLWGGGVGKQDKKVWSGGGWGFAIHVCLVLPSSSGRLATTVRRVDMPVLIIVVTFISLCLFAGCRPSLSDQWQYIAVNAAVYKFLALPPSAVTSSISTSVHLPHDYDRSSTKCTNLATA